VSDRAGLGGGQSAGSLTPVIVQDVATGAVLMLGWANQDAIDATQATGRVHFWSRSRQELWDKGKTSGQVLHVRHVAWDCDADALLYQVSAPEGACHTGQYSCFGDLAVPPAAMVTRLFEIQRERLATGTSDGSYTRRLADSGMDRVLRKVGEEAAEFLVACKNTAEGPVAAEAADLIYHVWLALHVAGVDLEEVGRELARRHDQGTGLRPDAKSPVVPPAR